MNTDILPGQKLNKKSQRKTNTWFSFKMCKVNLSHQTALKLAKTVQNKQFVK